MSKYKTWDDISENKDEKVTYQKLHSLTPQIKNKYSYDKEDNRRDDTEENSKSISMKAISTHHNNLKYYKMTNYSALNQNDNETKKVGNGPRLPYVIDPKF